LLLRPDPGVPVAMATVRTPQPPFGRRPPRGHPARL